MEGAERTISVEHTINEDGIEAIKSRIPALKAKKHGEPDARILIALLPGNFSVVVHRRAKAISEQINPETEASVYLPDIYYREGEGCKIHYDVALARAFDEIIPEWRQIFFDTDEETEKPPTIQGHYTSGKIHNLGRYACCPSGDMRSFEVAPQVKGARATLLLSLLPDRTYVRNIREQALEVFRTRKEQALSDVIDRNYQEDEIYGESVAHVLDIMLAGWDKAVFGESNLFNQ